MTDLSLNADRLLELVGTVCNKGASENDFAELNSILLANEVSRRQYLNYCRMHASLRLELRSHAAAQKAYKRIDVESGASVPRDFTVAMDTSSLMPFGILSTAYHGTIGFFSQELPFSLLIATVLTSLGLWFASMIYISSPEKIAKDSLLLKNTSVDHTLNVVGKITHMVDCNWADPNTETFLGANVLLSRKFALASGLIEITYNTGAKVILQGPVTYEVESKNGGFLPVGKLTGKVEVKTAKGFAVRTPTATVTDLGTVFGVDVSKSGVVEAHVFCGAVEVQRHLDGSGEIETVRLTKDEAIRIDGLSAPISRLHARSDRFVTAIPTKDLDDLVAWYKFDKITGTSVLCTPDSSGHDCFAMLAEMTSDNLVPGRVGNALKFNVAQDSCNQRILATWTALELAGKSFSIAFWLNRSGQGTREEETIFQRESGDRNSAGGYAILRVRDSGKFVFRARNAANQWTRISTDLLPAGRDAPIGVWIHFAVVGRLDRVTGLYDITLYHNGRLAGGRQRVEMAPVAARLSIGAHERGDSGFLGLLDDVRIYRCGITDAGVKSLYDHPGDVQEVRKLLEHEENR